MKKIKITWGRVCIASLLLILIAGGIFCYKKLDKFEKQLSYLLDTTSVILSDVSGLENGIEQTLQKEIGKVEDYSIDLIDLDLKQQIYEVAVSVVPKEYTDTTKVSVYFGTKECKLEREGYIFRGSMHLPIDNSYLGNLTFLFTDGKKKTTEIYSDYAGVQLGLEKVLLAEVKNLGVRLEENLFSVRGEMTYTLDGQNLYEFESLNLVLLQGKTELYNKSLLAENSKGTRGTETLLVKQPIENDGEVCLLLRARTTEGYRFEYQFYEGTVQLKNASEDAEEGVPPLEQTEDGEEARIYELTESPQNYEVKNTVYDNKGGSYTPETKNPNE